MIGETHRRIAKEIAKALNLNEREANLLEVGSVSPDSWADFPHHKGKDYEIIQGILKARRLFLQGDDECFSTLGNALHYIEDRWTMRPRLEDKHTRWEYMINSAPLLDDQQLEEQIKKTMFPTKAEQAYLVFLDALKKGVFHPSISEEKVVAHLLGYYETWVDVDGKWTRGFKGLGARVVGYALQDRPTTWSSPILDFNIAYRICLEVARNVFSKEHDEEDWYAEEEQKQM